MTPRPAAAAIDADNADRLQRIVARLGRVLRQPAGANLTLSQVSMLGTISKCDGSRLGALAAHESIGAPVATRVVASLEAMGFVMREADELDGRASRVHITGKGTRALQSLRRERAAALVARMQGLTANEREALSRALPVLERLTDI